MYLMHIMMKFFFKVILIAILSTPFSAQAKAVFNITPSLINITIPSGGSATVSYSVVNNTSKTVNQIGVNPAYQTNGNPAGITLQNDTCSGATLIPKATCAFTTFISGANQPSSFILRPRVCGYNGVVCSVPLGGNEVTVGVTAAPAAPISTGVSVTSVNPSNTSVAVTTNQIVINFNTAMNPSTLNSTSVSVVQNGTSTNLISSCTPSAGGTSFACFMNASLANNVQYNVTVNTQALATSGKALSPAFTTSFFTQALIAGDGTTHTYYVNSSNAVSISTSGGTFTPITFSSGSPTGTVILIAGNGNGNMFFATSTNQIWQNSAGGAFSASTVTSGPFTGNIVQLGGSGSTGSMYFATSTGQVWGGQNGAAFAQSTIIGGAVSGTISQITGDGVSVACFLTTANQTYCGFFNSFTLNTFSGGTLSGNIIRLTGIVNATSPIDVSFYTSSNQLWVQSNPGGNVFNLATFTGGQPSGIIQQMASNGNGGISFVTTTNQTWDNGAGGSVFSPVANTGTIVGQATGMDGNEGYTYFSTSSNQLFEQSTTTYAPLSVGFSGGISAFSGSGGYMYFVTLNNQIWANNLGGTFAQVSHP
jgi:hypothetical protein